MEQIQAQSSSKASLTQSANSTKRAKYLTPATMPANHMGDPEDDTNPLSETGSFRGSAVDVKQSQGMVLLSVEREERDTIRPSFQLMTTDQSQEIHFDAARFQDMSARTGGGDITERRSRDGRVKQSTSMLGVEEAGTDEELTTTEPTLRDQVQERGMVELGDIDSESDQVLLGSAFDDTRSGAQPTFSQQHHSGAGSHTHRRGVSGERRVESEVIEQPSFEEDEHANTQRNQEAWRRETLLDQMQEDESQNQRQQERMMTENRPNEDDAAVDYPLHQRFARQPGQSTQEIDDQPPTLNEIAKDSMMSFGFMGSTSNRKIESNQANLLSEQSEDFYVNTGRSDMTNTQRQTANHDMIMSPVSADSDGKMVMDAGKNGQFSNLAVVQPNYSQQMHKAEVAGQVHQYETQKQHAAPLRLQTDERVWQTSTQNDYLPTMQLSETPVQKNERFRDMDRMAYAVANDEPTTKLSYFLSQEEAKSKQMFRNEHQELNQHVMRQPSSNDQAYSLARLSPSQTQPSSAAMLQQSNSSKIRPAEQFLTLDHFLNDQASPPQNTNELQAQRQGSSDNQQSIRKSFTPSGLNLSSPNQVDVAYAQSSAGGSSLRKTEKPANYEYRQRVDMPRHQVSQAKSPRMASTSPLRVDPDEIKRRQITRQQTLEQKRKQEFEDLRRQARERELVRQQKLRAVILIQKWVRGHLCRLEHARMRANFRYIRKLRRMLSIAHGRRKTKFIKQLVFVIKETGKRHQKKFEEEIGAFCATLIQKVWRGYHFRRVIKARLLKEFRSKRQLRALIQGWRTRCILFRTRECVNLRRDIQDIIQQTRHWQTKLRNLNPATTTKQQHVQIKTSIKQLKEDRQVKISQLIRTVAQLKGRGRWVYQVLPAKPALVPQKKQVVNYYDGIDRGAEGANSMQLEADMLFNQHALPPIETNQKYFGDDIENENSIVLPDESNKKPAGGMRQRLNHDVAHQNVEDNMLFSGSNGILIDDFSPRAANGVHDETARNLIASVGGPQAAQEVIKDNDDDDELAAMWPSQKAKPQDKGEADELAMMWPSQKAAQPAKKQTSLETVRAKIAQLDDSDRVVADEEDIGLPDIDQSVDGLGIVWPSANNKDVVASGDLNSAEKLDQHKADLMSKHFTMPDNEARVVNQNSIVIESKWKNEPAHWEDQPIRSKNNAQNPFGAPQPTSIPVEDQIIPAAKQQVQTEVINKSQQNMEDSVVSQQAPKFGLNDFEAMIEKAMKEAGQEPPPKSAKGPAPKSQDPAPSGEDREKSATPNPAKKKKNEQAAALLEKRKRYDPRKALKKGKKGTSTAKKQQAAATQEKFDDIINSSMVKDDPPKTDDRAPVKEPSDPVDEEVKVKAPVETKPYLKRKPVKHQFKKKQESPVEDAQPSPEEVKQAQQPAEGDDQQATKPVAPKPFLKRKTKTMQPAKINWQTKSRIDCWNESKSTSTKREMNTPNPPAAQKSSGHKMQIEAQQELEQSMPKFSDNHPDRLQLRRQHSGGEAAEVNPQAYEIQDTDYECETVPNESMAERAITEWQQTYQQDRQVKDGQALNSPGDLLQKREVGGTFQNAQKRNMTSTSQQPQAQVNTLRRSSDDDFEQEPLPRQMASFKQQYLPGHHNQHRPQMPNSRQPMKTPPDTDTETQNYNTFSQPDFAQPSEAPNLSLGHSYMAMGQQAPFINETRDTHIDISDIQAQISSVMTQNHDASGYPLNNGADGGVQSNLQLEELQKVFDLFHIHTETVDEVIPVPQSSLQRLQERGLPRAHSSNRSHLQQTRQVTRKTLKNHTFAEVQIDEVVGQDTCIPHLDSQTSIFFQSYVSDQFEDIFEDLKGHYKRLCEEEPNNSMMMDDGDDEQNMSQF